ncbi:MAG TPA: AbrB/MazE/SpoVT family DNA-binding domain-containing protein [Caulobacteraceae bacterium]|nr:AbrB/MazE/SpoVT family DNA-binding domain-containing protein [Caulobacteraceae bacterium]
MSVSRAKLFNHGGSQAVRLPKEFRFQGKEVAIRKEGDRVILEPVARDMKAFWAEIDRIRGDAILHAPEDPPAEDPGTSW